ncbi:TetR/AcrR family transcriptional regulator [Rothia sp. HC945]|uniref:TetR/AcrR family transcriptional regulator n=1 Tax=Rothia sp. HC945 TaxID=3171170 RepID=UPI00264C4B87|nr:TetR/AcrR family transcriptional regulator [Kocuria sp.]MDN5618259.1 TetR/AcrR family transcriptional regulator [Kocuria sp.]
MPTVPATQDQETGTSAAPSNGARRGRPGYDREKLISVCVQVFNEYGYDTTSMGMLSSHLGISKSAIYHHVNSKEEILEEALLRALDSLEKAMDEVRTPDSRGIDQLEGVIRGSVQVLVDQMPYVTLLLRLRGNSPVEIAALERRRRITRTVEELVRQAQDEGDLREDISGKSTPRLILGMINSIVDWYQPGGPGTTDQLADTAVKMVLDGLRA